jgi:hypothetical protein
MALNAHSFCNSKLKIKKKKKFTALLTFENCQVPVRNHVVM